MKNTRHILFFIMISVLALQCGTQNGNSSNSKEQVIAPEKNDEGEWELIVIDTQYDYFLKAIAKPISMYSIDYLKNRNVFLVNEWNSYYYSGRYRNIIESVIDYNPNENYGLEFEYRLYQVFAYTSWKYGLRLNGLSQTDRTR